jgi:hypothetical protein
MNWRTAIFGAVALGVLAAGASAWLGPRRPAADPRVSRWNALPAERRAELIAEYEQLVTESQLRTIDEQAAELRRLSSEDRARFSWLTEQMDEAMARLTPAQRASIRELPPAAQAVHLYHLLDQVDPGLLDRLARAWRGML